MRRLSRALIAFILAAAPAAGARAVPAETLVLLEDFGGQSVEASRMRQQLQRRLNDLSDLVAAAMHRPTRPWQFNFTPTPNVERGAHRRWKDNTIAIVWGTFEGSASDLRPDGTIYIGPYWMGSAQGPQRNGFDTVRARILSSATIEPELGVYEMIIGYALLNRAWREDPSTVPPIAEVLLRRYDRVMHGTYRSSACLADLQRAITDVRLRAGRGERPSRQQLMPILGADCTPRAAQRGH